VIVAVVGVSLLVRPESNLGPRRPGQHASSAPVVGRCAAAALRASVIEGGAEASQPFVIIGLTNTSRSACSLLGYPEVTVRGTPAGNGPITALPSATIHGVYEHADPGPHLVTISPHVQARFALGTNTASGGSRPLSEIWQVTISLPGGGGQLPLALTSPMYASGQPLNIGITAVEPGIPSSAPSPP